ncbi:MAG: hypothetical protein QF619_08745, partial [Candidatus Binatia bacterium]|nr:hypothetical protein [Candidatus Binatia bacterium]
MDLYQMGEEDYREVASFIQGFVHRAKWVKGAEGLCLFGAAVLLLFDLGLGVDQIKALFPYAPLVYSLLASTSVLILAVWTLYQCVRKISKEWAARTIEERFPALRNNLINSLQLYPRIAQGRNEPGLSVSM